MPLRKAAMVPAPLWRRVRQVFRPDAPPRGETVTSDAGSLHDFGVYHDQFNPDPVLQTTGQGLELYRRMLFDDKIAGTLDLQKRIVLSADWEIKPASDRRKDIKIAEFVKQALEDEEMEIPILDVLDNLLDAKPYGFKVAEKLWRERVQDGKQVWLYRAIKCKPSFNLHFWTDKFSNLECVYAGEWFGNEKPPARMRLPLDRIIVFVWPYVQDGNWNGTSVLSQVYREWFGKQHMYKFRNIDAQKFGMPTVRCYINEDNTTDQDNAIKNNLDKWPENLVVYIPTRFTDDGKKIPQAEIDFLEKKTQGSPQFDGTIEKLNTSMARKLLTPDQLGFTEVKYGSRAQGETQFNIILLGAVYTHHRLSDMANAQIIPDLVRYNYGDTVDLPKWAFLPFEDPAKKAEALKLVIDAGVIDPTEDWVRPYLQFPERPPEIEGEPKKEPAVPPPETPEEEPPGEPEKETMAVAGRFDHKQALAWFEEIENEMAPIMEQAIYETANSMMDRARSQKLLEEKDYRGINKLEPKGTWKQQIRKVLLATESRMYFQGRLSGVGDLRRAGVKLESLQMPMAFPAWVQTEKYLDRSWLKEWFTKHRMALTSADRIAVRELTSYSFYMAGVTSQSIVDEVGKLIYTNLNSMMPREIVALVDARVGGLARARAQVIVRNNASSYFNRGRMETFSEAREFIQGYDYDAIMDEATTPFCAEQNGRFIREDNPSFARIQPPNHDNCRSVLVPRMKSDRPPTKKWRQSLLPAKAFGG